MLGKSQSGHQSTGKSSLLKPGSSLTAQYVPLLIHESSSDRLRIKMKRERNASCSFDVMTIFKLYACLNMKNFCIISCVFPFEEHFLCCLKDWNEQRRSTVEPSETLPRKQWLMVSGICLAWPTPSVFSECVILLRPLLIALFVRSVDKLALWQGRLQHGWEWGPDARED